MLWCLLYVLLKPRTKGGSLPSKTCWKLRVLSDDTAFNTCVQPLLRNRQLSRLQGHQGAIQVEAAEARQIDQVSAAMHIQTDVAASCSWARCNKPTAACLQPSHTCNFVVQAALQRGTKLAACVSEAVRLQAPGMDIRIAAQDVYLPASSGRKHRVCKVAHTCNLLRQGPTVLLSASVRTLNCPWPSLYNLHLLSKYGTAAPHEVLWYLGSDLLLAWTYFQISCCHRLWLWLYPAIFGPPSCSDGQAELTKKSS